MREHTNGFSEFLEWVGFTKLLYKQHLVLAAAQTIIFALQVIIAMDTERFRKGAMLKGRYQITMRSSCEICQQNRVLRQLFCTQATNGIPSDCGTLLCCRTHALDQVKTLHLLRARSRSSVRMTSSTLASAAKRSHRQRTEATSEGLTSMGGGEEEADGSKLSDGKREDKVVIDGRDEVAVNEGVGEVEIGDGVHGPEVAPS